MPSASILPLALFAVVMLLSSLHALATSGHFPKASRLPTVGEGFGPFVLWTSVVVTVAAVVAAIVAARTTIPWYSAVIGGAGAILLAPLVLQTFPDRIVDGRIALVGFSGGAAVLAALLCWLSHT